MLLLDAAEGPGQALGNGTGGRHPPERPSGLGPGPRPVLAAAGVWLVLTQPQGCGCCPPLP